jgi:hypothetical protein
MNRNNASFNLTSASNDKASKGKTIVDGSERTATTASSTTNSLSFNDGNRKDTLELQTPVNSAGKAPASSNSQKDPMDLLQVSMSSLSVSASPATKANYLYGKLVQKEKQILLQSLVEQEDSNTDCSMPSMFAPLNHDG